MSNIGYEEEEFQSSFNGRTLLRIWGRSGRIGNGSSASCCAVTVVSFLNSYFTYLSKQIVDEGITPGNRDALINIIVVYGLLIVVQSAFVFAFIYLTGALGHRVQYDMRKTMFEHLQELSLSYYNRTPVGWIMSRLTSDTDRIAELVTWGMLDICWAIINIFTALFFMATLNWQLALLVFAIVPVLVVIAMWFQQRIMVQYRIARKANSRITGAFNENITGVRVVKALEREDRNLEEFSDLTENMYHSSYRAAWLSSLFLPAVQIVAAVALGGIVYFGGKQVEVGTMTIGAISAFISYVTFMLWPVQDLARVFASMQYAIASAERTFSLIDAKPEVVDKPTAYDPGTISGDIVFDHVDFFYDNDTTKPVLRDFNLTVKRGETIALVGPTGAGKSTVVNLICRFFEPRGGRVTIGGHRLHRYDPARHSVAHRHGAANTAPVQRHDPREFALRQARRERRASGSGLEAGRRARVHHHTRQGL